MPQRTRRLTDTRPSSTALPYVLQPVLMRHGHTRWPRATQTSSHRLHPAWIRPAPLGWALDPSHTHAKAPQHVPHTDDTTCTQTTPHDLPGPPPWTRPALSAGPLTWFHVAQPHTMCPRQPRPGPPLQRHARPFTTCRRPPRPPLDAPRPLQHAQPLLNVPPMPQAHALPCLTSPTHPPMYPHPSRSSRPVPHTLATFEAPQPLSTCHRPYSMRLAPFRRISDMPCIFGPFSTLPAH